MMTFGGLLQSFVWKIFSQRSSLNFHRNFRKKAAYLGEIHSPLIREAYKVTRNDFCAGKRKHHSLISLEKSNHLMENFILITKAIYMNKELAKSASDQGADHWK